MFQAPPPVDPAPLPALEVRGETECPRPADVAAALAGMLSPAAPGAPGEVVELREEGGWFVITLRRTSGDMLGEKRLPATLDCAVRARAAAVSIAAMEAQLGGGAAQPLPVETPPDAPPDPPPASAAPPAVADVAAVVRPPDARARFGPEAGATVLASWNGTDLAPGARFEVAFRRAPGSWGFVLAGLAVGTHRMVVPPGDGSWWRVGGELALWREEPAGRSARLQAGVGVAITALKVEGHGFSRNASDWLLDPGPVARLRLVPFAARVRPWLEVTGVLWPRSHRLTVGGGGPGQGPANLPELELYVGVGASFGGPR